MRVHQLAFAYCDAVPLFQDVSFQLSSGWTGLIGANGAGKTTLLRVLAGDLMPTAGTVAWRAPHGHCVLCPQRVEARDALVQEFAASSSPLARRLQGQLRLNANELLRWQTLSPGERKRWQLGAALAAEPDILLLDEPTNHLDAAGRALVLPALRTFKGIGIIVSHDRAVLNNLTSATLRLKRESAELLNLAYERANEEWEREREARLDAHRTKRETQQRAARRLAQSREEMRSATRKRRTSARMRNKYDSDARSLGAATRAEWSQERIGRTVALARHLNEKAEASLAESDIQKEIGRSLFVRYEPAPRARLAWLDMPTVTAGAHVVLSGVQLSVPRDARIWISGNNGAGKTTLLKAMIHVAALPDDRVLFLPQELTEDDERAMLSELKALEPRARGQVMSLVAALGVDVERLLGSQSPSPGEGRKLALALGLARHVWLLVLDEPTNHLDLLSIERLEAALRGYPGALLLVSHDDALARASTNERWHLENGRLEISTVRGS